MVDLMRHVVPMSGRSADEEHRASTPLELFFDLVVVIAVAAAAGSLEHAVAAGDIGAATLGYALTFFAIWWAWMGFTWFANAYDTDDVPYRIAVFVQMTGAIIIAAGIPRAFADADWSVALLGYIVMRMAVVALWLRAARSHPEARASDLRSALGVTVLQVGWVVLVLGPRQYILAGFVLLGALELLVPVWASRVHPPTWHGEHIAERYGLLTIIVLGESVLAATVAISAAVDEGTPGIELIAVAAGALLIVFTMWWLYFERNSADLLTSMRRGFTWGYGHYFILAAAAAVGAGIAVAVEVATHHGEIGPDVAGAAVAVPVSIYLAGIWVLHDLPRPMSPLRMALDPIAIALVLVSPLLPHPVLLTGIILVSLLAAKILSAPRQPATTEAAAE